MTSMMTERTSQIISVGTIDQLVLILSNVALLLIILVMRELFMAYDSTATRAWGRTLTIPIAGLLFSFGLDVALFFYRIVDVGGI